MSIATDSPVPQPRRTVYFNDHLIIITSDEVVTARGRFAVAELRGVVRCLTYTHPGRAVALITGGVELALALPLAIGSGSALMLCAGFTAAAGVAVGVLVDARRNPRWMELRAVYRGVDISLVSSRDKAWFESVRRALTRAVEANRTASL